ncbi:hypothetical protein BU17DRAFT_87458 [Hysterangium stoloniferum]|nr:hypothetical protein BU17DRAFT_87458 [Hysterangium stoloniferum]
MNDSEAIDNYDFYYNTRGDDSQAQAVSTTQWDQPGVHGWVPHANNQSPSIQQQVSSEGSYTFYSPQHQPSNPESFPEQFEGGFTVAPHGVASLEGDSEIHDVTDSLPRVTTSHKSQESTPLFASWEDNALALIFNGGSYVGSEEFNGVQNTGALDHENATAFPENDMPVEFQSRHTHQHEMTGTNISGSTGGHFNEAVATPQGTNGLMYICSFGTCAIYSRCVRYDEREIHNATYHQLGSNKLQDFNSRKEARKQRRFAPYDKSGRHRSNGFLDESTV